MKSRINICSTVLLVATENLLNSSCILSSILSETTPAPLRVSSAAAMSQPHQLSQQVNFLALRASKPQVLSEVFATAFVTGSGSFCSSCSRFANFLSQPRSLNPVSAILQPVNILFLYCPQHPSYSKNSVYIYE